MAIGFYFLNRKLRVLWKLGSCCHNVNSQLVKIFMFELKVENLDLVPSGSHSKETNIKKQT